MTQIISTDNLDLDQLRLLLILSLNKEKGINMTQLAREIGRSTTTTSSKLKILDNTALIKIHREGKKQVSFILQAGTMLISEWSKTELGKRLTEEWKKKIAAPID